MATRRQPSRAVGSNPVPEPSQQNPPRSPPGRARSPEGPPPPPDRIALLEGQVQRLTELLMGFLDGQHQQAQHSRAEERREPPREEESYRRDENPQRPGPERRLQQQIAAVGGGDGRPKAKDRRGSGTKDKSAPWPRDHGGHTTRTSPYPGH
ncbi:uncharacterized protein LOC127791574 [Diospyros lotus]|uniref:uncharacterized protein LOC127791574 n=1 Tax=Diospyros lotus TaxID=55363 RepID=UPI00225129DA|nr:uncharacterized protein LOC127791574 [Diospyros lotus]